MIHPRKRIRHALRDRLALPKDDGEFRTMARENVFASRMAPITDEDYPAILIYTREEKDYQEPIDDSLTWRKATLFVVVECLVRAGESVDDKLDDFALQVEDAFDGWAIPGFESASVTLSETDIDIVSEQVRRPIGAVGLTYRIEYRAARLREPVERIPDDVWTILHGDAPGDPTRPPVHVVKGGRS